MQSQCVATGCAALFLVYAHAAGGQTAPAGASSQNAGAPAPGSGTAQALERTRGRIDEPAISGYLQRMENRIASAIGAPPAEVRVTRSAGLYVSQVSRRVLCLSGGMLRRIESEGELAGLLAHELAHAQAEAASKSAAQGSWRSVCVLQTESVMPESGGARERERQATAESTGYLKAAGYDPAGVLDLLSKLAYEHPVWAKAIVPEDLLALRIKTEADVVPAGGYRMGSSEFVQARTMLETALSQGR